MFRRVLFVGFDEGVRGGWAAALRSHSFGASFQTPSHDLVDGVDEADADIVVFNLNLAHPATAPPRGLDQRTAISVLGTLRERRPSTRCLAHGGAPNSTNLLELMRAGACDYLVAPITPALLIDRLNRAVHSQRAIAGQVSGAAEARGFEGLLGCSAPMLKLYDTIERAAQTDVTVLLCGESGTGKEVIARTLHKRSPRSSAPFAAVNCAALPPALIESELFGHARGAFTGASSARSGLFVAAGEGTIFLDEIGELPLAMQPKLLRALQERRARAVGSDAEVPISARVIAATNQDLQAAITARAFRADLFYRLDVVRIDVPPLRDRRADIALLARYYVGLYAARMNKPVAGIDPDAVQRLLGYDWPGNVRELQNSIERAVALTRHKDIHVADLPRRVRSASRLPTDDEASRDPDSGELLSMQEMERRHVMRVLRAAGGNRKRAAEILDVDRKTLYRKLRRYGLYDPSSSPESTGKTTDKFLRGDTQDGVPTNQ